VTKVHEAARAIKARSSPGSSVEDGKLYHELPFRGVAKIPSHRGNTRLRIEQIGRLVNLQNAKVLDLGCGPGGIAVGLSRLGARVLGIDSDPQAIKVARALADHLDADCYFVVDDVGRLLLEEKKPGEYDVVVWLSQLMWLRKQHGHEKALEAIYQASKLAPTLVFETAADDGEAGVKGLTQNDIRGWLRYAAVQSKISSAPSPGGGWFQRRVFVLERPQTRWDGDTSVVRRTGRRTVTKTYKPGFEWMAPVEWNALDRLRGSGIAPSIVASDTETPALSMTFSGWRGDVTPGMIDEQRSHIVDVLDQAGIEHRDIRPSNLVALDGRLNLIDFGWGRLDGEPAPVPDPPQLNDREDGRGKWGGPQLYDDAALRSIAKFMRGKRA